MENVVSLCFCSFMLPGQYFSFPHLLLSELLYLARTGVRGQTFRVPGVGISLPYANPNLKPSFLPIISLSFPQARHQIGCKICSVINILHFSASVCFKTLIFFCREHICFLFFWLLLSCCFITIISHPIFLFVPFSLSFLTNFSRWVRVRELDPSDSSVDIKLKLEKFIWIALLQNS